VLLVWGLVEGGFRVVAVSSYYHERLFVY